MHFFIRKPYFIASSTKPHQSGEAYNNLDILVAGVNGLKWGSLETIWPTGFEQHC